MAPASPPADTRSADPRPLGGRKVVVALTGGIACYKTATVVSRLAQRGAAVRVIMTDAATRFITPLTLQSLSGHPVLTSIWDSDDRPDSQHIGLARWCDAMLIAPATANCLAKLAHGFADDLVSLVAAALPRGERGSTPGGGAGPTPLLVAPAMNADMWANPAVQRNVATVRDLLGATLIGPAEGWQACRTTGPGRMAEPDEILAAVETCVRDAPTENKKDL